MFFEAVFISSEHKIWYQNSKLKRDRKTKCLVSLVGYYSLFLQELHIFHIFILIEGL